MAIDFPNSPSTNDTYTVNGRTYIWNGEKWLRAQPELTSVVPTLTVSNDLTVDTDTLHVDSTNNRVGIGTTSPSQTLDVVGKLDVSDDVDIGGGNFGYRLNATADDSYVAHLGSNSPTAKIDMFSADSTNLYVATAGVHLDIPSFDPLLGESAEPTLSIKFTDTTAVRIKKVGSTFDTSLLNGNVGIGTTSPSHTLDVNGKAVVGGGDNQTPDASGNGHLMIDGSGYTGFASLDGTAMWVGHNSGSRKLYLATDETARLTVDGTGNVGINDTTPSYTLDVNGDINTTSKYLRGGKATGDTLLASGSFSSTGVAITSVFSSSYANYRILLTVKNSNSGELYYRMMNGGTWYTSSVYEIQRLYAQGTSVGGTRTQANSYGRVGYMGGGYWSSAEMTIYNPYITRETDVASHEVYGDNAYKGMIEVDHSQVGTSTSFDGIFIGAAAGGTMYGSYRVYGIAQ